MVNPPQNYDDAFYLHPSDNPRPVLVLQHLTEDNFSSWRRAMLMALDGKNKVGFVDGSIPKPAEDQLKYHMWIRNNNTVSSWLLNSTTKEIDVSVIYTEYCCYLEIPSHLFSIV